MPTYVSIEEAAERLDELLNAAVAGEDVIVTDNSVPQVRLEVDYNASSEGRSSDQKVE